ncbi:hypothetical protein QWZ13_12260 [Reinekea marina]|nr:hypothetical protein [Reinekea marina]MDN3649687.1 hypothetical protein [Reinekea marina]
MSTDSTTPAKRLGRLRPLLPYCCSLLWKEHLLYFETCPLSK